MLDIFFYVHLRLRLDLVGILLYIPLDQCDTLDQFECSDLGQFLRSYIQDLYHRFQLTLPLTITVSSFKLPVTLLDPFDWKSIHSMSPFILPLPFIFTRLCHSLPPN